MHATCTGRMIVVVFLASEVPVKRVEAAFGWHVAPAGVAEVALAHHGSGIPQRLEVLRHQRLVQVQACASRPATGGVSQREACGDARTSMCAAYRNHHCLSTVPQNG